MPTQNVPTKVAHELVAIFLDSHNIRDNTFQKAIQEAGYFALDKFIPCKTGSLSYYYWRAVLNELSKIKVTSHSST